MKPEIKIDEDGTKKYFLNGKLHRSEGPAVENADGSKIWYLNGERHRLDGPAVENADGTKEWYINGKDVTNEIKIWLKEYPLPENETLFKLTWT